MLQRRMFRVQLFDLVLGEITDAGVFVDFAFTPLQLQPILHRTGQQFDQGRLARSVSAQQSDAVARQNTQLDAGDDGAIVITGIDTMQPQ